MKTIRQTERTYEYDPADALDSPEAVEAFVTDAFETGDASYIARALGVVARAISASPARGNDRR